MLRRLLLTVVGLGWLGQSLMAEERYRFPPTLLFSVLDPPHKARINGKTVLA